MQRKVSTLDALKLLREMERKYVRAIKAMRNTNLAAEPSAKVLREVEENLGGVRRNIRQLETGQAKSARSRSTTKRKE